MNKYEKNEILNKLDDLNNTILSININQQEN